MRVKYCGGGKSAPAIFHAHACHPRGKIRETWQRSGDPASSLLRLLPQVGNKITKLSFHVKLYFHMRCVFTAACVLVFGGMQHAQRPAT